MAETLVVQLLQEAPADPVDQAVVVVAESLELAHPAQAHPAKDFLVVLEQHPLATLDRVVAQLLRGHQERVPQAEPADPVQLLVQQWYMAKADRHQQDPLGLEMEAVVRLVVEVRE